MSSELRVLLVGNYLADAQPSMLRFTRMLHDELAALGADVDVRYPPAIVGGRKQTDGIVHKWRGYVDKYLLYPPRLRRGLGRRSGPAPIVHVCDHSNAVYVPWLDGAAHVVTCHDLIAVRSALGEFPAERTRWTGRRLQQMILNGLRRSSRIVCDSDATRRDVTRIVGRGDHPVVHPGVSSAFHPLTEDERRTRLARFGAAAAQPYLLHVGGGQWYKNRPGVFEMYDALTARMIDAPRLLIVGSSSAARGNPRITTLSGVDDGELAALYASAELLLFPSLVEGFGWPVLEAMASGCRVVTSDRAPMTEVAGDVATYVDPEESAAAAAEIERVLREPDVERRARIDAGIARAARFSGRAMAQAYLSVYQDVLARASHAA